MSKIWLVKEKKSDNIIEQVLANRQIPKKDWQAFLSPDFGSLYDPFLLSGMRAAVDRIKKAIAQKEIVGIFADYDADGIPGAALLADILENKLGIKTVTYIPTRREGYGLNKQGIDILKAADATLIITVDLGIRNLKEVKYAQKIGLEIIVTDHHEPGDKLPQPLALINPKLKASKYPFRELSGGGVVFKLIQALSQKVKVISEADLKWALDLVAITTICDVVPLVNENRIFAKFGLMVLAKSRRLGLKRLYKIAEIDPAKIDTYTVGFQIGPRLNAPGRMEGANESFQLLRAEDPILARNLAVKLDSINRRRQAQLDEALTEAEAEILKNKLLDKKVILLTSTKWSSGIIGLIAGKITEKFSRPTIILEKGEEISKGSARSIDNYNIVEVLEETRDLLENFGGHAKAAGLTIKNKNIPALYDRLLKIADTKLTADDLVPKITIDARLTTDDLKLSLYDNLKKLEPFGMANPRPVFVLEKVHPQSLKAIGQDSKHLRFNLGPVKVIGFGLGQLIDNLQDKLIDIAFTIDEDCWDGTRKLQLKIIDLKY